MVSKEGLLSLFDSIKVKTIILIPYLWLLFFFLIPFFIVFKISLSDADVSKPPYYPTVGFNLDSIKNALKEFDLESYIFLIEGVSFNTAYAIYSVLLYCTCFLFLQGIRLLLSYVQKNDFIVKKSLSKTIGLSFIICFIIQKIIWTNGNDFIVYGFVFLDNIYASSYISSLKIALITTTISLIIAYPIAYGMASVNKKYQSILLLLIILPFWTSFLVRVYAWVGILKNDGYLNQFLQFIGIIDEPITILYTDISVYIGIVYSYLPFLVLPIYASLQKMDESLIEAAKDMGCTSTKAFWYVTFPLSLPGVVAGCFLVFIPAVGEFVIPDLLGGSNTLMIGKTLWSEFFYNRDWPVASAVAIVLLFFLLIPVILFQRFRDKKKDEDI